MGVLTKAVAATLAPLLPGSGGSFWPINASGATTLDRAPDNMTPDRALSVSAYLAGVRVLAEGVASLPLITYRRLDPQGKERAPDHPLYRILHDQANPLMTSFTWRETAMGHVVTWGNSYNELEFSPRGLKAIWPLRPDRMTPYWDADTQTKRFRYRLPNGTIVELPANRVLHIRGLSFDGLVGYAPLSLAARSLGLSVSSAEYAQRTYDNNARPGVVITHPKQLTPAARKNLEESWKAEHEGLSNAQRTAILEEGVTVTQVGFPPEQAQLLEMRNFEVREIARFLGLRPHKIGDLTNATFSNIEQQAIDHVVSDLRPWLVRWEQQINVDLIADQGYFVEFLVDALLRGDSESRSRALAIRRQNGVLTGDEWREIENQNPLPDGIGDEVWMPLNYTVDSGVKGVPGGQPGQQPNPGAFVRIPLRPASAAAVATNGASHAVRCSKCDKLLAQQNGNLGGGNVEIKCPRCGTLNHAGDVALVEAAPVEEKPDPVTKLTEAVMAVATRPQPPIEVQVSPQPVIFEEGAVQSHVHMPPAGARETSFDFDDNGRVVGKRERPLEE